MKRIYYACYIGLYAGLIWGLLAYVGHYFEFTAIKPNFLVAPFLKKSLLNDWQGHLLGLLAFVLYSVIAALLYSATLHNRKGPWPGIMFGIVWWLLVYAFAGPYFAFLPPLKSLELDTWITELCRHVLWGVFIGYSISLEFTDEREREPVRP